MNFVRPRKNKHQGFSLVEVVLALGIVSFTFLSMLALIPQGLKMSREAADATTESQIVQFVRNQLQLTSFSGIGKWNGVSLYFDVDGLPVTSGSDPAMIYTVQLTVADVSLADTSGKTTALAQTSAQTIQIAIVNRTAPGTNNFSIVVPNEGA